MFGELWVGCKDKKIMSENSRLNYIYKNMKQRCYNTKCKAYKNYGGRGITICDEWLDESIVTRQWTKGWFAFKQWALSHGYNDTLTIDRIDNSKGYSPENCRWTTPKEQSNNTRMCHYVVYKGQRMTISQWCDKLNLDYNMIKQRIGHYHWSAEKAFETPVDADCSLITYREKTQSIAEWCRELDLNYGTIKSRITKGWPIEKALSTKIRKKAVVK